MKKIVPSLMLLLTICLTSCGGDQCKTDKRYLVITSFAGMANRLRVLASAKIMGAITDRHVLVDWPLKSNEMTGYWSDFFLNPLILYEDGPLHKQGCSLDHIKGASSDDPDIKNLGRQNDKEAWKVLAELPKFEENIIYFRTTMNFVPDEKFLKRSDFDEQRRLFYQNLSPVGYISERVEYFKKKHDFSSHFMVGVHYRGWQTGAPDRHSNLNPDDQNRYMPDFIREMKEALRKPLSQTHNKSVAFFLATDNQEAKDSILEDATLNPHVFTRGEPADRSTIDAQRSDLVDFFLLGSTEYIIGTNQSSFSDEASHLTRQDRKIDVGENAYKK